MGAIRLLDCTLRDGGYINDWEFGYPNLISVFERVVNAGVDVVEVGFLDERRKFDINRSIMPDTECVQKIFGKIDKKDAIIVGMIDYGTCPIENLQPCSESYLDGIRVIFKKHLMYEAMEFCRQVKALGYKVFSQLVSITSYSDDELDELIRLANEVKPFAVSMVDTYGLFYKDNLMHYFNRLDEYLNPEIGLGYHSHNNFQLAYSNCMEILRKKIKRDILLDATLYGMGKSAGNAPIELLAMHMNEDYGKDYDISQILEAIDGNIMKIYQEKPWGYNLFYYLAASNSCHPNYVQFLMDKHTLSIKSINTVLNRIDFEKKLLYDEKHIEQLYYEHQKKECNDTEARHELTERFSGKKILVLGPGKTIVEDKAKILKFIEDEKPIVMSINFIPDDYPVEYVFLSNPRRYISLLRKLRYEDKKVQIIATSNVTETKGNFDFTLNNEALLDRDAVVMDYSFVMLLKVLMDKKVDTVFCAGLDGYAENGSNYAAEEMEYWFARRNAGILNNYVKEFLKDIAGDFQVKFLTETFYLDK